MARSARRLATGITVVVLAGGFGAGWFAAQAFQSPAQREAEARPPSPGPIFNQVTYGPLESQVSGRGPVRYQHVSPVVPTGLPTNAVVTARKVRVGSTARAGTVLTEINGRPVFVVPGRFAFFRDLTLDVAGPDVTQLQRGLRAAGYTVPRSEDGHYGRGTKAAVAHLYADAGYRAPATGLPLNELAVTPTLPATVSAVAAVGDHPEQGRPIGTLVHGNKIVTITIDASAFVRLKMGMKASVTVGGQPPAVPARVSALSAGKGDDDSVVTLTPLKTLGKSAAGQDAVAVITVDVVSSGSLLVPARAVATGATGSTRVLARRGDGLVQVVEVSVLGTLGGVSAVRPVVAGTLVKGDMVQVG